MTPIDASPSTFLLGLTDITSDFPVPSLPCTMVSLTLSPSGVSRMAEMTFDISLWDAHAPALDSIVPGGDVMTSFTPRMTSPRFNRP